MFKHWLGALERQIKFHILGMGGRIFQQNQTC